MIDIENVRRGAFDVGLEELSKKIEDLESQMRTAHCCIPVFGGVKAGKSTLLSSLLSCETSFFPPDVLEATARSVRVVYGMAPVRKLVLSDEEESLVDADSAWAGLVTGVRTLAAGSRLEIEFPSALLRDGPVDFVDTPGNNTMDSSRIAEIWNGLSETHMGIYCINASSDVKATDLQFLKAARQYLGNFIFVITQVDLIGAKSAVDDLAVRKVEYIKKKINELIPGVDPIAFVATTTKCGPADDCGFGALSKLILKTIRDRSKAIENAVLCAAIGHECYSLRANIANEIALLEKLDAEKENDFQRSVCAFKARLTDLEREKKGALSKLVAEVNARRLGLREKMRDLSQQSFENIQSRLDEISNDVELEQCGTGVLMAEVEQWRSCARRAIEGAKNSGDEILQIAAGDFLAFVEREAERELKIPFKVCMSEVSVACAPAFAREALELCNAERHELELRIGELESAIKVDADEMPELRANIEALKRELSEIEYHPEYVQKRYGTTGGESEEGLRHLGAAIDVALMFAPIPLGKLKWLSKFKYGKQIRQAVKSYNKLVRGKNRLLVNTGKTIPGMDKVLEGLSVEHWAGKLGHLIDESGVEIREEEDPEIRRAYEAQIAPFEAQIASTTSALAEREREMSANMAELADLKIREGALSSNSQQLEREIESAAVEIAKRKSSARLAEGKKQLIAKAANMFLKTDSELTADVYANIDLAMNMAGDKLESSLTNRIDATIAEITGQLEKTSEVQRQEDGDRRKLLDGLCSQRDFLDGCIREFVP